jgi:hypothetical protein
MRITSSGNVGIGKTTPSTKLDVSGTVTATAFAGALTGNVTGNADTATTLATARTIAGQSFDGSANITIASTDLSNTSNITLNDATQTLTNKTLTSPVIAAITSTADIDLTATNDVNIPVNVGLTFGDDGEKIEGNGTLLSISSSNNLVFDVANDILLDAGNGGWYFNDDATTIGSFTNSSSNFVLKSNVSDKDLIFKGNDGGSEVTALLLDGSEAGAATFNNNVTAFSDVRLKSNIKTFENGLDAVEKLRGVRYTRDDKENIGVIAQEIEEILPEIVLTADDKMGTKSVDYSRLTAVLIEAVKDLSARVKELEGK